MGLLRFFVSRRDQVTPQAVERAYFTGLDEVPWACRIVATEDGLIVDRPVGESGTFHIPWRVDGQSEILLSTASLIERSRPYLLELELARGTLNRIRNQLSMWENAGMVVPDPIRKKLSQTVEKFSRAATSQDDTESCCNIANEVILEGIKLIESLGASYSQQALQLRHSAGTKLPTMLGANLGSLPLDNAMSASFLETFNAAMVPMAWRQVEVGEGQHDWTLSDSQLDWCAARGLRICSGPLVRFDGSDVPDWLYLWEGDAESIMTFVAEYVRAVVQRFTGRLHVWQCASRVCGTTFLGLSAEYTLRMAVRVIEIVRELDGRTPVIVTFDQPWGEFITRQDMELPLYFADSLMRSNLGLAGIGLEFNVGYHPGGTLRRDVLEFSRQLDRWTLLGLPLMVNLAVPGGTGNDSKAKVAGRPVPDAWTPQAQEEWIRQFLPVILSKQAVQAVMWSQLRDADQHDFAHGGLFDAADNPKPGLKSFSAIRKSHVA